MKIRRLTIAGFGPYKTEQTVDFGAFDDDGIFLITGQTGSGKSSILDAICFAFYASVPRYENTQQQLRSDYAEPGDPTFVELEFTSGGHDYRVRRSPEYERPKSRGQGFTKQPATAQLFVRRDDDAAAIANGSAATEGGGEDWEGIAALPRDVGPAVEAILGLTKDQFLQVILLAQNRFQKFLHAKNDDRQAVLQSLFKTRRFTDIERALVERRKVLETRLSSSLETLAQLGRQASALVEGDAAALPLEMGAPGIGEPGADAPRVSSLETGVPDASAPGVSGSDASGRGTGVPEAGVFDASARGVGAPDGRWFDAVHGRLDDEVARAATAVRQADASFDEADAAHRALEQVRRLQARRYAASTRLAQLEQSDEAIDADRRRLEQATRAEIVWAHVRARETAHAALDEAESRERAARQLYVDLIEDSERSELTDRPEITENSLSAEADEVTRQLGALEAVLAEEGRLPALNAEIDRLLSALTSIETALADATLRIEALPPRIESLAEQRSVQLVRAAAQTEAAERVTRVRGARASAAQADKLEQSVSEARVREKVQSAANREASEAYDELLARRLDGHAAELASALVEGEPCSVCGSTTHPYPTRWSADFGEPVTDAQLDAARKTRERAALNLTEAGAEVQDALARLAAAQVAAGGRSLDELDADLASAEGALTDATEAVQEVARIEGELGELRAMLDSSADELAALRAAKESAFTALAEKRSQRAAIEQRVSTQRAEFERVSERGAFLQRLLDATRALGDALVVAAARRNALDEATATLRRHLDQQRFTETDEAVAARLTSEQREALDARVRAHDLATATALATLAEPELAALPEATVELDEASDTLDAARLARDAARAVASALGARAQQLRAIVTDARQLLEASAAQRLDFEQVRALANAVEGNEPNTMRMRLETYVLAAQLEEIIRAANARLSAMTSGRYTLQHDDSVQFRNVRSGLGLAILDEHTGRSRATHSLSGGETFLASLALALGLAEVVSNQAGGITLDTLFVDEGFGSLDPETLAIALSTLDSLRAGGRTIGLISHVDAMKEQIPAHLRIRVAPRGDSEIA